MRKAEMLTVDLLHRAVAAVQTDEGLRALSKGRPIKPESVQRYLKSKFGEALDDAHGDMMALARSMKTPELARRAQKLYEEFRPKIPAGVRGSGAAGRLDLDEIRNMAG